MKTVDEKPPTYLVISLGPPVAPTFEKLGIVDWASRSHHQCNAEAEAACTDMCLPKESTCVAGKGTVTVMLWVKMTGDAQNGHGDTPFTMGRARSGGNCNGWAINFRRSGGYAGDSLLSHYCEVGLVNRDWKGADYMKWLHIALVIDGIAPAIRYYVDGNLEHEQSSIPNWNDDICSVECPVMVGGRWNALPWLGETADVRIFKGAALSAEEIKSYAQMQIGGR